MTVPDDVLSGLLMGAEPADLMRTLGISRYHYDSALSILHDKGVLALSGDLPLDAEVELCPPDIASKLFLDIFNSAEWATRIMESVRSLCARYGIVEPSLSDPRYTRSRWTGQAYRRVDFTAPNGIEYMVIGALMPRVDKKRWKEGTPYVRTVYVEGADISSSFVWQRGRFIPDTFVKAALSHHVLTAELLHSLTLAVAWVCEARAIFPERNK